VAGYDFLNQHRLTGVLFILAFISFAIGGTLPVVGAKGNMRIFTLPAFAALGPNNLG
jgi:hypothetical protein